VRGTILASVLLASSLTAHGEGPRLDVQEVGLGPGGVLELSWAADPQHPAYLAFDVVHGDLAALRASGGNFSTSLLDCVGEDAPAGRPVELPLPAPGGQLFFLVRAQQTPLVCGMGSWNEDFTVAPLRQAGDRNPEIVAAGTCPCP
jgi:hypothetical protein